MKGLRLFYVQGQLISFKIPYLFSWIPFRGCNTECEYALLCGVGRCFVLPTFMDLFLVFLSWFHAVIVVRVVWMSIFKWLCKVRDSVLVAWARRCFWWIVVFVFDGMWSLLFCSSPIILFFVRFSVVNLLMCFCCVFYHVVF